MGLVSDVRRLWSGFQGLGERRNSPANWTREISAISRLERQNKEYYTPQLWVPPALTVANLPVAWVAPLDSGSGVAVGMGEAG